MAKTLPQANPTLDKMAQRVALAGTGVYGPILKGLGGRVVITVEKDETLVSPTIFSYERGSSSTIAFQRTLTGGTWASLGNGRRTWTKDIVFGVDTDFGASGALPIRNYFEWTIRKRQTPIPSGTPSSTDDDRPFFDSTRVYSLNGTMTVSPALLTGIAFREDEKAVYLVSSDRKLASVDREGTAISGQISLSSSYFNNPQAITYLGSERFAVLDRGNPAVSRAPAILLFHFPVGSTSIETTEDLKRVSLDSITETATNLSSGLAYDPVDNLFYLATSSTSTGGLWLVDPSDWSQTLLFNWSSTIIPDVDSGALVADIFYAREMAGGLPNDSLFVLCSSPSGGGGTAGQRKVVQVNKTTGSVIATFSHGLANVLHGFTFDPNTEDMFIGHSAGSLNLRRYEHSAYRQDTTFRRQFYVKDLPLRGSVYLHGQEAQQGESVVFVHTTDTNLYAKDVTFSINILPVLSDEFFLQHEYSGAREGGPPPRTTVVDPALRRGNRWANTLRNWGGAATAEVFINGSPVISETDIGDIHGYYWNSPSYGLHTVVVRLRASEGSSNYVDITGYLRIRQIACPGTG